jgi:hypothetical protein
MNLYVAKVGRPPFNRSVTFCRLAVEGKHAANVFHFVLRFDTSKQRDVVLLPPNSTRLPDKELQSLVGTSFEKWKSSLNAVEIPATLFNERFGLRY